MKGFIEVTRTQDSGTTKVTVAVSQIKFIEEEPSGLVCLALNCIDKTRRLNQNWTALCIAVTETYAEVLAKIAAAVE